jgi:hypothetical protein
MIIINTIIIKEDTSIPLNQHTIAASFSNRNKGCMFSS